MANEDLTNLLGWCRRERESLEMQREMLRSGKFRIFNNEGSRPVDVQALETRRFAPGSFSSPAMSTPMRRTRSACCARTANGHAAALPSPAMNSRRRIRDLPS